jgi:hypothetical protein
MERLRAVKLLKNAGRWWVSPDSMRANKKNEDPAERYCAERALVFF